MASPVITVEIDFSTGIFDDPVWVDVSAFIRRIPVIRRGRTDELGRWVAGIADIVLDNDDARFTPGNEWSPYAGLIKPMRKVRIYAVYEAVTYYLFRGFIEAWPPEWFGGLISEITIRCVDGFKVLAQARVDYSWGIESSHWRIIGVLNALGWPGSLQDIPTSGADSRSGKTDIPAVTLSQVAPLSHILDVVEAEDGQIFVAGNGNMVFRGRHNRLQWSASTTVQATFGDDLLAPAWILGDSILSVLGSTTVPRPDPWSGTTDELPYENVLPSYDDSFIINDAQITATGGTVQQAEDADSQEAYGVRSRVRTLLLTSDSVASDMASWLVQRYAEPDIRFPKLVFSGLQSDNLWIHVLGREISDRIKVVKRYPGSSALVRECFIEAIEHHGIVGGEWETVFTLSPAVVGQFWILEDSVFGVLESTTRLAY